jgi:3-oxoacyl-[acyl-carrier-protein] synthase II
MREKATYFLNGIGIISPQKTFERDFFLTEIAEYHKNVLTCIPTDFKAYINPIQMRRLSRMLRIGLSAATICLRDSGVQMPDGIITATGYGFLDETAKFLKEILQQSERQLTPTYFMQSTSNALAGLVALTLKCMGYNNTYVSKGFAFENALADVMMPLNDNTAANFLVGTYDEAAEIQYNASIRATQFKTEYINSLSLFETKTKGSIQGEGSAFFMISGRLTRSSWCTLKDLHIVYKPEQNELKEALATFLDVNNIDAHGIDVLINGVSGDIEHDKMLTSLVNSFFEKTFQVRFKHLCGEYCTATSFALWLAASILKKQEVPEIIKVQKEKQPTQVNTILILNQYMNTSFSFILLKAV